MKVYSAVLIAALVGFVKAKGVDDAFAPNVQNDVDPLNVVARLTMDGGEVGGVATSVAVSTSNIRGAAPFSTKDVVNMRDWDSNNSINLDLEDDSQVTGDATLVAVSTSNIRGAATFSIKDVVDTKKDWDSKDSINLDLEDDPKDIGGICSGSGSCLSGYCVSGFCRQCPNAGSATGCPSGEFCQRLYTAQIHVCRPKKDVGGSCSGNDSCLSNDCSSLGFCNGTDGCPKAGSRTGCPSGQYCKWVVTNNKCVGLKPRSATCGSNNSVCQSGKCNFGFCTKP